MTDDLTQNCVRSRESAARKSRAARWRFPRIGGKRSAVRISSFQGTWARKGGRNFLYSRETAGDLLDAGFIDKRRMRTYDQSGKSAKSAQAGLRGVASPFM